MSNNAMWWVGYVNAKTGCKSVMTLCSPDLADPKKAHKRARDTAKARLAKRGVKAIGLQSRCVA